MALPNFLCVGAEKAGTTPLWLMLGQHPDIYMPPQKETAFFSRTRRYEGPLFYEAVEFSGYRGQPVLGELTPEYMRTPGVARAVREALGRIKIIICLREPVRRAFSHYLQCLRLMEDNRSFAAACRHDASLPLWSERHADIRRAYVRGSRYAYQVKEWLDEFGRENLFFSVLERDFVDAAAKAELIARVFSFVGVSQREIDVNVYDSSLPPPRIVIFGKPRNIWEEARRETIEAKAGDILFWTGQPELNRLIVNPSPETRLFLETMSREMTATLDDDAARALRQACFGDVAAETSELIGEDLTQFWKD